MNASRQILIEITLVLFGCSSILTQEQCSSGFYNFRLPEHVAPKHYWLHIQTNISESLFSGHVQIELIIKDDSVQTNELILHADPRYMRITEVAYEDGSGAPVQVTESCFDYKNELLVVRLAQSLESGSKGRLVLQFIGRIREDFKHIVRASGQEPSIYLSTSFEPSQARSMYPCFDEPKFKASYELSLVHPIGTIALSNMEVVSSDASPDDTELKVTRFARTPKMSSYLFAFVVGDFDYVQKTMSNRDLSIRIFAPKNQLKETSPILNTVVELIGGLEDYFAIEYPLKKLDLVTITDTPRGPTKSFGLIQISPKLLFANEDVGLLEEITNGLETLSRQLTHQFLGNIVTIGWWDEICLNDGLTSWLATNLADSIRPTYEVGLRSKLLGSRISPSVYASKDLRLKSVSSREDIYKVYDRVVHQKVMTIVDMLHDYVGPENFQAAVRDYVEIHKYKSVRISNLVDLMERRSGLKLGDFVNSWIDIVGSPVLRVEYIQDENLIEMSQRNFPEIQPKDEPPGSQFQPWIILSSILISDGLGRHKKIAFQMDGTKVQVKLPEWFDQGNPGHFIKINSNCAGAYSAEYSSDLLNRLIIAVQHKQLPMLDRLDLLMNTIFQYEHTIVGIDAVEDLYTAMGDAEEDPIIMNQMLIYAATDSMRDKALAAQKRLHYTIGFIDDSENAGLLHRSKTIRIFENLMNYEYEPIISDALKLFDEYSIERISRGLRGIIYLAVAIGGSLEQFKRLLELTSLSVSYRKLIVSKLSRSDHLEKLEALRRWTSDNLGRFPNSSHFLSWINTKMKDLEDREKNPNKVVQWIKT